MVHQQPHVNTAWKAANAHTWQLKKHILHVKVCTGGSATAAAQPRLLKCVLCCVWAVWQDPVELHHVTAHFCLEPWPLWLISFIKNKNKNPVYISLCSPGTWCYSLAPETLGFSLKTPTTIFRMYHIYHNTSHPNSSFKCGRLFIMALHFFFLPVWLILRCITGLQEEQQLQSNPLETENFPQWALGSRIHTNYTHRHRDRETETERESCISIFVRTFIGVNIKGIMHFTSQSRTNPQYLRLSLLT